MVPCYGSPSKLVQAARAVPSVILESNPVGILRVDLLHPQLLLDLCVEPKPDLNTLLMKLFPESCKERLSALPSPHRPVGEGNRFSTGPLNKAKAEGPQRELLLEM